MSFDKKKDWDDFYFDQFLDLGDGKEMHIRHEGNTVWFGSYPQSLKEDGKEIVGEPNESGYVEQDGESYVKVKAQPYDEEWIPDYPIIKFDSGEEIEHNKEYYFRVEPIEWKIIKREGNRLTLISKRILAAARFDEYFDSGAYDKSEIKEWLQDKFYFTAFDYYERQMFERKKEGVRLLTLAELEDKSIFADELEQRKYPTDYAKATWCGIFYGSEKYKEEYADTHWWWVNEEGNKADGFARVGGLPKNEYPSTGDVQKDIEELFASDSIIEFITRYNDFRNVNSVDGGVVPVIEIELPENFD